MTDGTLTAPDDRQRFAMAVLLKALRSGWMYGFDDLARIVQEDLTEDERRLLWHILSATFHEGDITDLVREWVSYDRFPHGLVGARKMRDARAWAKGKSPATLKAVAVAACEKMTTDDFAAFLKWVWSRGDG